MRREETELRRQHPAAFDAYAAAVPLFFPRIAAKRQPGAASFSWAQYRKNHEHQAAIGFLLFLLALVVIWRLHVA